MAMFMPLFSDDKHATLRMIFILNSSPCFGIFIDAEDAEAENSSRLI